MISQLLEPFLNICTEHFFFTKFGGYNNESKQICNGNIAYKIIRNRVDMFINSR